MHGYHIFTFILPHIPNPWMNQIESITLLSSLTENIFLKILHHRIWYVKSGVFYRQLLHGSKRTIWPFTSQEYHSSTDKRIMKFDNNVLSCGWRIDDNNLSNFVGGILSSKVKTFYKTSWNFSCPWRIGLFIYLWNHPGIGDNINYNIRGSTFAYPLKRGFTIW